MQNLLPRPRSADPTDLVGSSVCLDEACRSPRCMPKFESHSPRRAGRYGEAPTSEHNVDNQQLVTKDDNVNLLP